MNSKKVFFELIKNHKEARLVKNNYQGWLVVEAEQDPKKANPFEYAKIGFNYLKKTSSECGLEIIS